MQVRNYEGTGKIKKEVKHENQSHILSTIFFFFLEEHVLKSNKSKLSILLGLVFPHVDHLKLLRLGHSNSTTNKEK